MRLTIESVLAHRTSQLNLSMEVLLSTVFLPGGFDGSCGFRGRVTVSVLYVEIQSPVLRPYGSWNGWVNTEAYSRVIVGTGCLEGGSLLPLAWRIAKILSTVGVGFKEVLLDGGPGWTDI